MAAMFCFVLIRLFMWNIEDPVTAGTLNAVAFEVRGDFELQPAEAGQKYELIDPSHNVADLPHLLFEAFFLRLFRTGLAQGNIFLFAQSGNGNDGFFVRDAGKSV